MAGGGEAVDAGPAARLRRAHLRHRKGRQRRDLQVGALLCRRVVGVIDAGVIVVMLSLRVSEKEATLQ